MILRDYQTLAVDCTWAYMRTNAGNPAIVIPTAGGKSLIMAQTARMAVEQWGGRVGIVAASKELVGQNFEKMKALWPESDCGIYSASLNRRDRFNQVMFLQVQSVAKRMHELGSFDLLLFDEFHLVPTKGEGLYRTMIEGARKYKPGLRIVGYSATPFRLGVGPVCGSGHIFDDVAYEARIPDLIQGGFLCPPISRGGKSRPDLSGVKMRGGEYVDDALARVMDTSELVQAACDEMVLHAADRQSWIVFAVSIAHAGHVADALNERGVNAAVVHGGTPSAERDRLIADFQARRIRALVNVNVLTTGFDAPIIDCVVMLRPTKSAGLYVQMVGRGFRIHPSKSNTLVLDFSGNTLEHGPVDAITVRKARVPGESDTVQTAPAKECPKCQTVLPVAVRICPECGYDFPPLEVEPQHDDRPSDAPILSGPAPSSRLPVNGVLYAPHVGKSGTPSLRVTYLCGLHRISEYVCVEHSGLARNKACAWWRAREPGCVQVPRTVDAAAALAAALPRPDFITATQSAKGYWEILSYELRLNPAGEGAPAARPAPPARSAGSDANGDAMRPVRGVRPPDWLVRALEGKRA